MANAGGSMAACSIPAPSFLPPEGRRFAAVVRAWQEAGVADEWEQDRYVRTPAMNAP